jgi:ethanolamine ammonia-lyase small subunit
MAEPPAPIDLPARLRAATIARVGLGRIGTALPTRASLDFQLAHARARDAVHAELAPGAFGQSIAGLGVVEVNSLAENRSDYLQRPDLGRRLNPDDLAALPSGEYDLAVVIGDGLSATAVLTHAVSIVEALVARLPDWQIAPVVVAHQARVALGDEIGAALGATLLVVLIGERPGLSAVDSVGAYISWGPRRGLRDNARNCISNIRSPHGLGYAEAADQIVAILHAARAASQTGVLLKTAARTSLPPPD